MPSYWFDCHGMRLHKPTSVMSCFVMHVRGQSPIFASIFYCTSGFADQVEQAYTWSCKSHIVVYGQTCFALLTTLAICGMPKTLKSASLHGLMHVVACLSLQLARAQSIVRVHGAVVGCCHRCLAIGGALIMPPLPCLVF